MRERARIKARNRRRFPRLMTYLFGPAILSLQSDKIESSEYRPDSLEQPPNYDIPNRNTSTETTKLEMI
jgi:hypothetical protein